MNRFTWPLRVLIFMGLLQVVACTKTVDNNSEEFTNLSTSGDATVVNEFDNCKLRSIIHEHGGVPELQIKGVFTYSKGNPVSLIYAQGGTGNPDHFFLYDKQNRLREYRIGYDVDDPVEAEWHKYGYNSNNQIIYDSIVPPLLHTEEGEVLHGDTTVITLTYDAQGRIIKESIRNITRGGPIRNPTYTYDARGNLAVKGWKSSSYDNKVSIFRAHPIFQFIHRNYSVNNAAPQAKYNSKGLPLTLMPSNDIFFSAYQTNPGAPFVGGITKVMYDCQ